MAAVSAISFKDLCIDAVNPELLAAFWASALGLRAEPTGGSLRLVDNVPEHTLSGSTRCPSRGQLASASTST